MAGVLLAAGALSWAAGAGPAPPAAVLESLSAPRLAGRGTLAWWGLAVYDASLWVPPGFAHRDFERSAFALELAYRRPLRAVDIARRSIEEMRRTGMVTPSQAQRWDGQLRTVLPDVDAGDRIAGVHRPGRGASFFVNGRPAGDIADPTFARLFFGIWLAPGTSEPALRAALLGDTPP